MGNSIKVSFVVPVYNTGEYLMYCLSSLVRQTLNEIEIICVDDGSVDNSREIIQDFAQRDSRVKIILQEHKGTASARNIGLDTVQGEYVHFVDSDDWISDNCAELTYNKAKINDFDLVCFNVANYDNKTKLVRENQFYPSNFWPQNCENMVLTWKNYKNPFLGNFSAANKIYKTSFLKKNNIRFIDNLWFEDHPFHLETLLSASKIGVINRSLYFYRKNIISSFMATMRTGDRAFAIFDVFDVLKNIVQKLNLYDDLRRDFLEYTVCLGLNMFVNSTALSIKPRFYARHREYCKQISKNGEEYMTIIHTPTFIHFMDVLKLPWFVFFLRYHFSELRQKIKNRKKVKNATK